MSIVLCEKEYIKCHSQQWFDFNANPWTDPPGLRSMCTKLDIIVNSNSSSLLEKRWSNRVTGTKSCSLFVLGKFSVQYKTRKYKSNKFNRLVYTRSAWRGRNWTLLYPMRISVVHYAATMSYIECKYQPAGDARWRSNRLRRFGNEVSLPMALSVPVKRASVPGRRKENPPS